VFYVPIDKDTQILGPRGYIKKLNYYRREWDPAHKKLGQGVTLSVDELEEIDDILNEIEL
jgi:hypothetical protein